MLTRRCFIIAATAALLCCNLMPAQAQLPQSKAAKEVVQGNNSFAFDLYRQLRKEKGNLFFSPYSISNALAMTYAGARGDTAAEMATTLHFSVPPDRFHPAFGTLVKYLNAAGKNRPYQLRVANRLWGQTGYSFLPGFSKITKDQYQAGLKELDFWKNTEGARRAINEWVEEQTNNKIKELIRKGVLKKDTRLVLTNAIYFKSGWKNVFHKTATKPGDFLADGGKTVKVPMMKKMEALPYVANKQFQAVNVPYTGNALSMVILLPRKGMDIATLEQKLSAQTVDAVMNKMKPHQVDFQLPRFKMTSEFGLKQTLSEMGMPLAFSNNANFSGMTTQEKVKISKVIHKAFVDVNEKGTEAAAATAVVISPTSAPILPKVRATFHCDRPFVFLIRENRTGSVLFVGRVANPDTK